MGADFSAAGVDMLKRVGTVRPNLSPVTAATGAAPESEQEQEQVLEVDEEAIPAKAAPDVTQPTEQERKDHELTHMPFRNWCPHCIAGKGQERNFIATDGPGCIPCFSADYAFMGEHTTEGTTPILVLKDDTQKSVFSYVVPEKGAN